MDDGQGKKNNRDFCVIHFLYHYLITGFKAESPDYVAKLRKGLDLVEKGE